MADLPNQDDRIATLERKVAAQDETIQAIVQELSKLAKTARTQAAIDVIPPAEWLRVPGGDAHAIANLVGKPDDVGAIASLIGAASEAAKVEQGNLPLGLMAKDAPQP